MLNVVEANLCSEGGLAYLLRRVLQFMFWSCPATSGAFEERIPRRARMGRQIPRARSPLQNDFCHWPRLRSGFSTQIPELGDHRPCILVRCPNFEDRGQSQGIHRDSCTAAHVDDCPCPFASCALSASMPACCPYLWTLQGDIALTHRPLRTESLLVLL